MQKVPIAQTSDESGVVNVQTDYCEVCQLVEGVSSGRLSKADVLHDTVLTMLVAFRDVNREGT